MGHEVVNVNAFNTDDPSSNPARLSLCFFSAKYIGNKRLRLANSKERMLPKRPVTCTKAPVVMFELNRD